MDSKKDAIKLLLNKLIEEQIIDEAEYNEIYNSYYNDESMSLGIHEQLVETKAEDMNSSLVESAIDIYTLFNELNSKDKDINRLSNLNESILNSLKLENEKIDDRIYTIERKITKGNNYVYHEGFRDTSSINSEIEYTKEKIYYDKLIEGLRLKYNNHINMLLSKTGERLGKIEILNQYCSGFSTYNNKYLKLENVIDSSLDTYWHEVLEVEEPIELEYNSNVTSLKHGAVVELLITMPSLMEINEINITPFCEFPLEVVEIAYSNNDKDDYNDFIPLAFNINNVPINKYTVNKASLNTIMYQFANTKAKRVKIVLNQIHYAPNHFISNEEQLLSNGIFIKENNAELQNRLLSAVNKAIIDETFVVQFDRQINHINKLQYEYGIYNISIINNDYYNESEYVSNEYGFPGLATIALDTNEEHYEIGIDDPLKMTSIEYEIIINDDIRIPILPTNEKNIKQEFLNTYQEQDTNDIHATTRFAMDIKDLSNIKIYKDQNVLEFGYIILDNYTIKFNNFDPFASYTIDYNPNNIIECKEIKLPTFTERIELLNIQLKATLKQNSREYTEVTPILYDYTFYATNVPVQVGEYNDIVELKIIPDESFTNVPYNIPVIRTGNPVLMEIEILQNPVIINTNEVPNTETLEPIDIVEIDENIE